MQIKTMILDIYGDQFTLTIDDDTRYYDSWFELVEKVGPFYLSPCNNTPETNKQNNNPKGNL